MFHTLKKDFYEIIMLRYPSSGNLKPHADTKCYVDNCHMRERGKKQAPQTCFSFEVKFFFSYIFTHNVNVGLPISFQMWQ